MQLFIWGRSAGVERTKACKIIENHPKHNSVKRGIRQDATTLIIRKLDNTFIIFLNKKNTLKL